MEFRITQSNARQGRVAVLSIAPEEIEVAYLNVSQPEIRNRSELYLRRHRLAHDPQNRSISSNEPYRHQDEPPKLSIPEHLRQMRERNILPNFCSPCSEQSQNFTQESQIIAISISDLVANLLRPCFHRDGLGKHRIFHLKDEPIGERDYYCLCFSNGESPALELKQVRFDKGTDSLTDSKTNCNLSGSKLVWAASVMPIIWDGNAMRVEDIAIHDYDLRHFFGFDADDSIQFAYEGWYQQWPQRVKNLVYDFEKRNLQYQSYYHSIIGVDRNDDIQIWQIEGTIPDIAKQLAINGIVRAGILDSGGSCAIYDGWMCQFLNHSWYYREPRGSILVLKLDLEQQIPQNFINSWVQRKFQ